MFGSSDTNQDNRELQPSNPYFQSHSLPLVPLSPQLVIKPKRYIPCPTCGTIVESSILFRNHLSNPSSTHSSDLSPSSQTISSHLLPFANPSSFDMDRHHDHTFYNPSSQRRRSIEYSPDEQDYDDTGGFYGPPSTTDMHHHDPFIDPSKYSQSHRDIHDNITQSHPDTSSGGFPAFTSSSSSSSTSARHLARHDPLSMTSG
ncbi:hypothetical protein ADUPG1_007281, partial [Aduncisulcus paluster]